MKPLRKSTALVKPKSLSPITKPAPGINRFYKRVCEILEASRQRVVRTVNTEMVQAWLIGQAIVEQEQKGKKRAYLSRRPKGQARASPGVPLLGWRTAAAFSH